MHNTSGTAAATCGCQATLRAAGERELDQAERLYRQGHAGFARRTRRRAHALLWAATELARRRP